MKGIISYCSLMIFPYLLFAQVSGKVIENKTTNSKILNRDIEYAIYLPPGYEVSERTYPVLYLLHGGGDDHTAWLQSGEVQFIADGFLFAQSNGYFAPTQTHTMPAEKPNVWSLEEESSWTPLDKVIFLSPTRIRIEFTNQSATDPLRVVTLRKKIDL